MPERINGGLALAGLGAVVLIVSLFLDWFEPSRSAWTVFELNDLVLAALALFTLACAAAGMAGSPRSLSYLPEGSIPYAGVGALIIVVATLIQHPPTALHSAPKVGAWLALAGALLVTAGGVLVRARISVVVTLRSPERRRKPTVRVTNRPEARPPEPAAEAAPAPSEDETETRPLPGKGGG
jgi:hypothetical protein